MSRISNLGNWLGLGCLVALLLLGLIGFYPQSVGILPLVHEPLREVTPSFPVPPESLPPIMSAPFLPDPDVSLSQPSALVPARPDRAEKKPARIVRSESYQRLETLIKKYAALHGVDEELVWAVMRHESGFDPRAVSPKGAMGLMQLMPGTAALLGVKDPFNVEQNIQGGIRYLEMCLALFDQDIGLAVAAYNAGPENVAKYQGCPPFPETINYVNIVLRDYGAGVPRSGLRIGSRRIEVEEEEVASAIARNGLKWNLPAPVVKVARPQWHVHPPRWRDFAWPGKLQALAAKSTTVPARLGPRQ